MNPHKSMNDLSLRGSMPPTCRTRSLICIILIHNGPVSAVAAGPGGQVILALSAQPAFLRFRRFATLCVRHRTGRRRETVGPRPDRHLSVPSRDDRAWRRARAAGAGGAHRGGVRGGVLWCARGLRATLQNTPLLPHSSRSALGFQPLPLSSLLAQQTCQSPQMATHTRLQERAARWSTTSCSLITTISP